MQALIALMGAGLSQTGAVRYLTLAIQLVQTGMDVADRLQDLEAQVGTIVAEGRDPTDDEWAALEARSAAAHDRIQSAAARRLDND